MTFDKSFLLQQMADDARQQFQRDMTRVDKVDDLLVQQMGGKSMGRIIGGCIFSVVWVGIYIFLYVLIRDMSLGKMPLIALFISLVLMALILLWQCAQFRYYGSITQTRNRLFQLRDRLENGESGLSSELRVFQDCRKTGWQEPLNPGESIPEELDLMEQTVSNMVALQSGLLQNAKQAFYYLACMAWTVAGCFALEGLMYSLFGGEFASNTIHSLLIIGTVISFVAELFLARFLWSQTNCTVTNLTLFATCGGPIIFCLLALAAALVVAIVSLLISLLAAALALIIGGSILAGICCGG